MARRARGGHPWPALVVGLLAAVIAVAGWMVWSGRAPIAPEAPSLDIDVKLPTPPTLPGPTPMPDPQPAPLPIPGG
jgi:hypothetical protein